MLTSQPGEQGADSTNITELQEKLATATAELNQFAYVASHDLKAPLRAIDNLALWIVEDIDDKQAVLEHTRLIQTRIKRAGSLLDDLLEYSRVGRTPSPVVKVSVSALVQDLYAQCKAPESFSLVTEFEVEEVWVEVQALEQVLLKLMHNAVLHHQQEKGSITIKSFASNENLCISVQDDGPGIEAKFHEKIFGMFEKMASKDEVEGSGLGLAIAKKVAQQYGASISLQSSLGAGACFTLAWPQANNVGDGPKSCR